MSDFDDNVFDDLMGGEDENPPFELSADDLLALEELIGSGDYTLEIRPFDTLSNDELAELRGNQFATLRDAINFLSDGGLLDISGLYYDEDSDLWGYYISYRQDE